MYNPWGRKESKNEIKSMMFTLILTLGATITLWMGNFIADFLQNKWRMNSILFIVKNDRKLDAKEKK